VYKIVPRVLVVFTGVYKIVPRLLEVLPRAGSVLTGVYKIVPRLKKIVPRVIFEAPKVLGAVFWQKKFLFLGIFTSPLDIFE